MIPTLILVGVALGVLLSIPVAWLWNRQTVERIRKLEQRARTAERLAELGTLTGGLAHEIKNPLSTIGLNLQLLREDLDEVLTHAPEDQTGRARRRFDALRREVDRLRDILEDFLRFAGRMKLEKQPTDLHEVIHEIADFYEPQAAAAGVKLRCQLQADPPTAPVDAALLKQAILNLLINATQAMQIAREKDQPHGGARDLMIRTDRRGDEVELHVIDTGPGIAEDVREKVFQPYFSTKRGGTGLGLPTSRRIIEEHGGRLTLHSEVGRGTDFTVALPA